MLWRAFAALIGFVGIGVALIATDLITKRRYGRLDSTDAVVLSLGLFLIGMGVFLSMNIRKIERVYGKDVSLDFGPKGQVERDEKISALLAKAARTVQKLEETSKRSPFDERE